MKHLGDITLIKGNEAPTVDCIIGGSPCQDLSLAGKRAGLAGARSGLYMEQIRIIKEMRDNDRANGRTGVDVRPRYMVWENVPGAFSTGTPKGGDFAAVLEEAIRVAEPEAPSVPVPEKGWPTSGCIVGECWSIAWRVLDAQYWGVPQRRRRICLVCDFNGLNAPKIVFGEAEHHGSTERGGEHSPVGHSGDRSRSEVQPLTQGLSGNTDESQPKGKETAGDAGDSAGGAVPYTLKIRGGIEGGGKGALVQTDKSATLSTLQDQTLFQPVTYGIGSYHSNAMKSDNPHSGIYVAETSRTLDSLNCGYPACNQGGMAVVQPVTVCIEGNGSRPIHKGDGYCESDTMYTLNTTEQHAVAYSLEPGIAALEGGHIYDGVSGTLRAKAGDNQMAVAYSIENHPADSRVDIDDSGKVQTLTSRMGTGGGNVPMVMESCLGNGQPVTGTLMANCGTKLWLGNQEAFSGSYHIIEPRMEYAKYIDTTHADDVVRVDDVTAPLQARDYKGGKLVLRHIIRRLTPLECERLQGFPDGWTLIGDPVEEEIADYIPVFDESKYIAPNPADFGLTEEDLNDYAPVDDEDSLDDDDVYDDNYLEYLDACTKARAKATKRVKVGSHKETNYYYTDSNGKRKKVSDSQRYRALGNSIALPPWKWVLKRLCACYERDATMASLFDGIGGFPYIWEQLNGKGSCFWASEIEEFPIAVTKLRFGGSENGKA